MMVGWDHRDRDDGSRETSDNNDKNNSNLNNNIE